MPTPEQLKARQTAATEDTFNRANAVLSNAGMTPIASSTPTISVDALQNPQKPLQLPQEQYQAPQVPDLSTLIADAQKQLAPNAEQQARESQLMQQQNIYATLLGQQPTKTEIEAGARDKFGVGKLEQGVAEISGQLSILSAEGNQLSAERSQIMDVLREEAKQQGRSVFAGGFAPEVASRTRALDFKIRTNAIEQMGIGAQYLAKQGQLTAAQNLTNRAVDLQFEEQERNVASSKARIDALQGAVERGDVQLTKVQNVALAERTRLLDNQQKEIEAEKQTRKDITALARVALENDADQSVVNEIMKAATMDSALLAAGTSIVDVKKQLEHRLLRAQIAKAEAANVSPSSGRVTKIDMSKPDSIANAPVSDTTKAVMAGFIKTKDLTPTLKAQVASELYQVGFNPNQYVVSKLGNLMEKWQQIPDESKGYFEGLKFWESKTNPDVASFESEREIMTREIARLFDVGVLSDQDVAAYTNAMPSRQDDSIEVVLKKASGIAGAAANMDTSKAATTGVLKDGREFIVGIDGETLLDPNTLKPLE